MQGLGEPGGARVENFCEHILYPVATTFVKVLMAFIVWAQGVVGILNGLVTVEGALNGFILGLTSKRECIQ